VLSSCLVFSLDVVPKRRPSHDDVTDTYDVEETQFSTVG
jgi:hypothetical protein